MAIVGEDLKPYVKEQILARQKKLGNTTKTDEDLVYFNAKSAWVKLASGVSVNETIVKRFFNIETDNSGVPTAAGQADLDALKGKGLAQKYVLFGGTSIQTPGNLTQREGISGNLNNDSYDINSDYGIIPFPGIQDVNIKCLNRGSLKKAKLKIRVETKYQLSVIDALYLRLGYTVFLEWGNSHYLNDSGNTQPMGSTLIESDFFSNNLDRSSFQDILPKIEAKRESTFGNYDGFIGKVSNFDWSFNDDGSYDINLELISLGDVIESLKSNVVLDYETNKFIDATTVGSLGSGNIVLTQDNVVNSNKTTNTLFSILYLWKLQYSQPITFDASYDQTKGIAISDTLLGITDKAYIGDVLPIPTAATTTIATQTVEIKIEIGYYDPSTGEIQPPSYNYEKKNKYGNFRFKEPITLTYREDNVTGLGTLTNKQIINSILQNGPAQIAAGNATFDTGSYSGYGFDNFKNWIEYADINDDGDPQRDWETPIQTQIGFEWNKLLTENQIQVLTAKPKRNPGKNSAQGVPSINRQNTPYGLNRPNVRKVNQKNPTAMSEFVVAEYGSNIRNDLQVAIGNNHTDTIIDYIFGPISPPGKFVDKVLAKIKNPEKTLFVGERGKFHGKKNNLDIDDIKKTFTRPSGSFGAGAARYTALDKYSFSDVWRKDPNGSDEWQTAGFSNLSTSRLILFPVNITSVGTPTPTTSEPSYDLYIPSGNYGKSSIGFGNKSKISKLLSGGNPFPTNIAYLVIDENDGPNDNIKSSVSSIESQVSYKIFGNKNVNFFGWGSSNRIDYNDTNWYISRTPSNEEIIDRPMVNIKILKGTAASGGTYSAATIANPLRKFKDKDVARLYTEVDGNPQFSYYMRFGALLQTLKNETISKIKTGAGTYSDYPNIVDINCRDYNDTSPYPFVSYMRNKPTLTSYDITKCIVNSTVNISGSNSLTTDFTTIGIFNQEGSSNFLKEWEIDQKNADSMNVYLSFEAIGDVLSSNTDKEGSISLFSFIKGLCDVINRSFANVNNLEPVVDETTNILSIADSSNNRSTLKGDYLLNPFGFTNSNTQGSFIRNVDLKTAITPQYATMVTVGATAGGYVKGTEATAFARWNEGITDRFKDQLVPANEDAALDTTDKIREDVFTQFYKMFTAPDNSFRSEYALGIVTNLNSVGGADGIDANISSTGGVYGFIGTADTNVGDIVIDNNIVNKNLEIASEFFRAYSSQQKDGGGIGFIPFNVGLKMDGISGIKIYNMVELDTRFLPRNYSDNLSFIVTAVNNSLKNGDWETELKLTLIPTQKRGNYTLPANPLPSFTKTTPPSPPSPPSPSSGAYWLGTEPQFQTRTVKSITIHITVANWTAQRTVEFVNRKNHPSGPAWNYINGIHWAIDRTGTTFQGIPEDKRSIHGDNWNSNGVGIEINTYGAVKKVGSQWVTKASYLGNKVIPDHEVVDLGFKWEGSQYYQDYTDVEITGLKTLIQGIISRHPQIQNGITGKSVWRYVFGLPSGKPNPGGNVSAQDASSYGGYQQNGIFSHTTGGGTHSDPFPSPKLINMLKSLGYVD